MLRNRILMAISLVVAIDYTGVGMVGPVRVLYAQSRGATLGEISAMASAFLLANFLAQYPAGWLADRWGHRRVILAGLAVQALFPILYLLVADPFLFIVLRLGEGLAAATTLGPARALIVEAVPEEQRGEAFGIFGSFFNSGFLLGPALGGLLAGTGYGSAYIGALVCRLVAIAVLASLVPKARRGVAQPRARAADRRALLAPSLLGAYLLAFGDYLYVGFDMTLLPVWMRHQLGATVTMIGVAYVAFALPLVLLSPFGGRLADRPGRARLILVTGLAQVPLYLAYGAVASAWLAVALFAVHGFIYALMQPAIDAHLADAAPGEARARVQSVFSAVGLLGAFVGANGLDALYARDPHLPLPVIGLAFGACVLIGVVPIRRWERTRQAC